MIIVNPRQPNKWKAFLWLQLTFILLFVAFLPIGTLPEIEAFIRENDSKLKTKE